MLYKRFLSFFLSLFFLCSAHPVAFAVPSGAIGTLELVYDNVNFRKEPSGDLITQLAVGTCLSLIREERVGERRWYYAYVDEHGYGYVRSDMAVLTDGDQRLYRPGQPFETLLPEKLRLFFRSLAFFEVEGRFERWNAADRFEFVMRMYEHNIIAKDDAYAKLSSGELSEIEQAALITSILNVHYGENRRLSSVVVMGEDWKQSDMIDADFRWYRNMMDEASAYALWLEQNPEQKSS